MKLAIFVLSLAVAASGLTTLRTRGSDEENPVTKVVNLLKEMKATAEAEAEEDTDIYEKMACWCTTNDKEKTEAIKVAEARIEALTATIETGTARAGELKTAIAGLKDEIADDQDALDTATALREKEKADFEAEDADLSESAGLLKDALVVLKKVQLVQKTQPAQVATANAEALVQVHELVTKALKPKKVTGSAYFSTMQKDLWDLFGSMGGSSAMAPRVITGLSQAPTGAAAGSKSYNSRSGGIFGLLETMKEQMDRDLAAAHKAEINAEISFQKLRASKEGEIAAATQSMEEKSTELANTNEEVAQAKQDLEDTKDALDSDTKFLMDLKERCKTADADYASRKATRQDEITAIGETIQILTDDEARDLMSKSVAFLQMGSRRHRVKGAAVSKEMTSRQHAASQLLQVARRHSGSPDGWRIALLAVSTQIDGFTKVKTMMDKMVVELKKQQEDEYQKHESCKKDIDSNEDATLMKKAEKKDLDAKMAKLTGELESLTQDLADLATRVSEAHIAMKQAGESRKKENKEFQQVVADQRATVEILHKALKRLKSFYDKADFVQVKQEPGAAVAPPPAAGKEFKSNGMSGGVMQLLEKIIQDAQTADQEAVAGEQKSQAAYADFVANTNAMLDSYEKAIAGKTEAKDKATADKLTTKQDLAATETALGDLDGENKALHLSCDYLLNNYNIRQTARQEEIESIQEAKSILSGADFGL
jgi:hypothetical protein